MTTQELYDYMKSRYPGLNETSFLVILNTVLRKISRKTKLYSYSATASTVVDQREYELPTGTIAIYRVDYDGDEIGSISEAQVLTTDAT